MRGGRLQEVPNIVIGHGNFWYFGKLVVEERWSLTRGGRSQRFDYIKIPVGLIIYPSACC